YRGNAHVRTAPDTLISWRYHDGLRRQQVVEGPAGQQITQAVVDEPRSRNQQVQKDQQSCSKHPASNIQFALLDVLFNGMCCTYAKRIFGQQINEGIITFLHLGIGFDATIERRDAPLHLATDALSDAPQRLDDEPDDYRSQPQRQNDSEYVGGAVRKSAFNGEPRAYGAQNQQHDNGGRNTLKQGELAQTAFEGIEVLVKLAGCVHQKDPVLIFR